MDSLLEEYKAALLRLYYRYRYVLFFWGKKGGGGFVRLCSALVVG